MNTSIQSHYQQPTEVKLNLGVSGNEQASQPVTYHMNQCELPKHGSFHKLST
jgi:hypothetical protein